MGKIRSKDNKPTRDVLKPYTKITEGNKALKAKFIESPIGPLICVSNENNLLMLTTIDSKHLDKELKQLTTVHSKAIVENDDAEPLKSIESELQAYFKGDLTTFKTPFDFSSVGTEFQQSVWKEIYKIEYGHTSTYSELAQRVGRPKSFRAVANACGRNPIAIVVPCHRIMASGNGLGGYSCGIEKKTRLLDLEKS